MIDKNILIELADQRIKERNSEILYVSDIQVAGSYCYNFHRKESDLDIVIMGKLIKPLRSVKSLGYTKYGEKHIAFAFIDSEIVPPNWGKYTLPHLSLKTGQLFFYNKKSILDYIKNREIGRAHV